MSTLQSCLEPLLLEPTVLIPSKHRLSFPHPPTETNCWNFPPNSSGDEAYVHPLSNRSLSSLSTKSLEMCTESLGSETGSDIDLIRDEQTHNNVSEKQSRKEAKARESTKKVRQSFPPPLTSITGGVRVRPHREGGRLVITAFSFSACGSYFQAERGDGRLRLSLLRGAEAKEEENVDEEESGEEGGGFRGKMGGGGEWSGSRCSRSRKRLQKSLQCCMAIS